MPALFAPPAKNTITPEPLSPEPESLKKERAATEALSEKERRKAANRVAAILTGPSGLIEEEEKRQDSFTSVLGRTK